MKASALRDAVPYIVMAGTDILSAFAQKDHAVVYVEAYCKGKSVKIIQTEGTWEMVLYQQVSAPKRV